MVAAGVGSVTDTDAEDPSTALVVVAVGTGAEGQPDNGTVGSFFSGSYGQLRLMADGSYEYQVNQTNALVQGLHTSADTLTDVFHYTIEDTAGASDDATFTITIHGANDLPQAIADTGSMTEESAATSFPVRANDTLDPDSTAANTISITGTVTATGPAGTTISNGDATAVVSGNDIQVTLNGDFQQLALTETATVTVPYTLTGDAGDTSTANLVVTVNGANDVPIANDDTGSMSENAAATLFDVRSNDTLDVDHTALNNISIGAVTASGPTGDGITGADVTTAVVGNQVQITLGADFQNLGAGESATIAVPYTLTGDQPGDTDGATLTVTVNGSNDAPVAGDFTFNGANAAIGNTALVVNDASDGAPDPVGLQKTITGDLLAGATTTGTALNVANTTIGSEDLTFQSISSNGGSAAGIILDNTGSSGGLHVTGTGTAGSGGTIANKSGADVSTLNTDGTANITGSSGIGILARNTVDLQLARMQLNDFSNFALIGQNVVGFSLTDSVINGTNGSNDAIDEGSVTFDNLRGTATISNTTITGGFEENVSIQNTTNTGGPLNMTVSGSTFATSAGSLANDAFQFIADGNSVMNLTLQNSTFTTARGDLIHVVSRGATSSIDVNFTGNTLSNNHPSILSGGGGATFEADNQVSNSVLTFDILNNTFRDAVGVALNVFKGPGGGTVSGTISGNTIGVAGVDLSGSSQAGGINVDMDGGGTVTVAITNNTIQEYNADGIHLNIGSALGGNDGTFNATVTGNTTIAGAGAEPGGFASNGFEINAGTNSTGGTPSGPDNHVVNLKLSGNNFVDGGNASLFEDDVNLRDRFSVRVNLTGYTGASNDATAIATYVAGQNPGAETVTVSSLSGDGFFNTSPAGSDPPQPPVTPLLAADGGVDLPDGSVPGDALTNDALVTLTGAAVARWVAAGVSAEQIATLNGTSITVADLGGAELGHYANGQIVIDVDAAGHGWFIDATPNDDVEFGHLLSATQLQTDPTGAPAGDMDLLTVLMHEMGHALGLDHDHADPHDVMSDTLVTGERRLPAASDVAQAADLADTADAANPAEAALPVAAKAPAGSPMVAGADSFVFDHVVRDAPASTPMPHIANSWAARGDTIDLSALVANLPAKLVDALLQVHADASDAFATLQVNARCVGGDQHWVDVAQFVGVHAGDAGVTVRGDVAQGYADWLL